jgi:hypothetical protein
MRTLLTVLISLTLAAAAVAQPRVVVGGGRFYPRAYHGGYAYGYGYPYGRYYAPYYPAPYYAASYYYRPYYYPPYYYAPYYYGAYAYGYPYGYYAPVPRVAIAIRPGVIVGAGWRTFGPY